MIIIDALFSKNEIFTRPVFLDTTASQVTFEEIKEVRSRIKANKAFFLSLVMSRYFKHSLCVTSTPSTVNSMGLIFLMPVSIMATVSAGANSSRLSSNQQADQPVPFLGFASDN